MQVQVEGGEGGGGGRRRWREAVVRDRVYTEVGRKHAPAVQNEGRFSSVHGRIEAAGVLGERHEAGHPEDRPCALEASAESSRLLHGLRVLRDLTADMEHALERIRRARNAATDDESRRHVSRALPEDEDAVCEAVWHGG